MADRLIEIAIRVFNGALGASIGLFFVGRRGYRLMRSLGIDPEYGALAITLAGGVVGLVWGKQIWSWIDRRFHGGWGRRPP
jgi:hypothetical protein